MSKPPGRRRNLVGKGGVEMLEVRVVMWFNARGKKQCGVETTTPHGEIPDLFDSIAALENGKLTLWEDAMTQQETE